MVANLVAGMGVKEAAEKAGVHRQRIWDWKQSDDEFQRMLEEVGYTLGQALIDEAVQRSLAELRELTPEAVDALRRGVRSNARFQLKRVRRIELDEDGKAVAITEDWEPVALPDSGLAVQAADKVLARIQEFNPKTEVEHQGQIELWILEVDGAEATPQKASG